MKKKTFAIIQARMGSTRLPGKVLRELCGKPMLHHIVQRIKQVASIDTIMLATSICQEDTAVEVFADSVEILEKLHPNKGAEYAEKIKAYTIALYQKCAEYAWEKGIIIADTKFEFGLDPDGNIVLGDEMLTPDSSRFWPREGYAPGRPQPSFDKQFVRDWLKQNPDSGYQLPEEVVAKTVGKYKEAYELLTGEKFA